MGRGGTGVGRGARCGVWAGGTLPHYVMGMGNFSSRSLGAGLHHFHFITVGWSVDSLDKHADYLLKQSMSNSFDVESPKNVHLHGLKLKA